MTGTETRAIDHPLGRAGHRPTLLGSLPFGVFLGGTRAAHPIGPLLGLASAALFYGGSAHLSALTLTRARRVAVVNPAAPILTALVSCSCSWR